MKYDALIVRVRELMVANGSFPISEEEMNWLGSKIIAAVKQYEKDNGVKKTGSCDYCGSECGCDPEQRPLRDAYGNVLEGGK